MNSCRDRFENYVLVRCASPSHLRMIFTATTIASLVAALFFSYYSSPLMAIPFICCAGASYLCRHLDSIAMRFQPA